MAIFDDAELPDFDVNNEIQIQTIEDGTITIKRNSVWTLKYWGQAIYAGFGSRDQHRITNQFTICLYFKPQTGGNPSIPLQGEALITLGHLTMMTRILVTMPILKGIIIIKKLGYDLDWL
jgi:hypothetical protein